MGRRAVTNYVNYIDAIDLCTNQKEQEEGIRQKLNDDLMGLADATEVVIDNIMLNCKLEQNMNNTWWTRRTPFRGQCNNRFPQFRTHPEPEKIAELKSKDLLKTDQKILLPIICIAMAICIIVFAIFCWKSEQERPVYDKSNDRDLD